MGKGQIASDENSPGDVQYDQGTVSSPVITVCDVTWALDLRGDHSVSYMSNHYVAHLKQYHCISKMF